MANPGMVKGMIPLNSSGRPKNSVRSIKGMLERFVRRNASPRQLQKMYDKLTENQKLEMITQIFPYVIGKIQPDSISEADIELLYSKLEQTVKDAQRKAG